MIQEYTAMVVFIVAIGFSVFSIAKYLLNFKKTTDTGCAGDCGCKGKSVKKLNMEILKNKSTEYKHVRLK